MGIKLRSSIAALILAIAIQGLSIGLISPNIPQSLCQPTLTKQVSLSYPARREVSLFYPAYQQVQLQNTNGAVTVNTHDENTILIEAEIRAFHNGKYVKEDLAAYLDTLIQVEEADKQLIIVSEPDTRPDYLDLEVHYTLLVPRNTHLALKESDGNVYIGKDCGRVLVDGNNTDIHIVSPLGPVEVQTANGRVRIQDAQDETIIETVNGNIYAQMLGGSLQATTGNGSISTHILSTEVGGAELTAMNGGITMVVSANYGATVNATTSTGVITTEIPLDTQDGVQKRREVRGHFGVGTSRLNLSSLNGDITIKRDSQ